MAPAALDGPELPIPDIYDPENTERWTYRPDQSELLRRATAWRDRHDIQPASADELRIHLLLIDLQKDFCFPDGTLYVGGRSGRGAIEDNDRIARFVYRNLDRIGEITCTLDTHYPHQIFSPSFWIEPDGSPPEPNQEITVEDIENERVRPNPALADWLADGDYDWLVKQCIHYCKELARTGRYRLYLWPPHCILGSDGHTLAGVIHEARLFHAFARASHASVEVKGATPLTEYYSALGPEVKTTFDGRPLAELNRDFIEDLAEADAVLIAGQAASHCVRSTIDDLLSELDERLVRKVYILRDCMSSVVVPDPENEGEYLFDFTDHAEEALDRFRDAGMHVVESTRPMNEWLEVA